MPSRSISGADLLDGEIPSLVELSAAELPTSWLERVRVGARMVGRSQFLTASTLSNDVFPAFCRPIMVMSISVALYTTMVERVST